MDIAHLLYRAGRPGLFLVPSDWTHAAMVNAGAIAGSTAVTRALVAKAFRYRGPDLGKTIDGIHYELPIVLSAGFDPNGRLTRIMREMSFGGEEIGSTTAHPCNGNPPPHMIRLARNKSIVVYKGLRNKGVDALIARLERTPKTAGFVVGISIALTNYRHESCDTEAHAIDDYVHSFRKLNEANVGDYYTLNISCPNVYQNAGEMFFDPNRLEALLKRIKQIPSAKPLYLKMPINLPWETFDKLAKIADTEGVNGLVIGNLNKNYNDLDYKEDAPKEFRGGLTGKPCFKLSTNLLRLTREKYGTRFTLIGVGGILNPNDALEKFRSGADLIQLISGMIFYSPSLMKHICELYANELRQGHRAV